MLRELMEEKDVSSYQLSKDTGIPYATLNDLINGKRDFHKITAETLYRLATYFDLTMDELYAGKLRKRVFYLYNEDRQVYLQTKGLTASYLGPKNLLSLHRVKEIRDHVVTVETYFTNTDGQIYLEDDFIDLTDILSEYDAENLLQDSYTIMIGKPNLSAQERLLDEACLVSDNMAIILKDNSVGEIQVDIINMARHTARMSLRLRDYAVLATNMSDAMQKRAIEAVKRNSKQIIEKSKSTPPMKGHNVR
ncbi:Cro/C1-type HTH DNA-binding domain-containing protein [Lachnospiraceae bacterium XBD2001]|nr:Cro/C1-type HTH DNA-binding domain-containing protein [Lachnospiraceae bacterium XBD2001]